MMSRCEFSMRGGDYCAIMTDSEGYHIECNRECCKDYIPEETKEEDKPMTIVPSESEGKKYDTGKPMVGTILRIFPRALFAIGSVIEYGTHKYPDPDNWSKNKNIESRYFDSAIRHMLKYFIGCKRDEESGKLHLAHAAWNLLAILEMELRSNQGLSDSIIFTTEVRDND